MCFTFCVLCFTFIFDFSMFSFKRSHAEVYQLTSIYISCVLLIFFIYLESSIYALGQARISNPQAATSKASFGVRAFDLTWGVTQIGPSYLGG